MQMSELDPKQKRFRIRPMVSVKSSSLRLSIALAVLLPVAMPVIAKAQSQGPVTSGGNLPYIASGQSEDEILRKKRAKAEAEAAEKARLDAEDKARQEAAKAAQPAQPVVEPAKVEAPKVDAPAREPEVVVKPEGATKAPKPAVAGGPADPQLAPADGQKVKVSRQKPQETVPPGLAPDGQIVGSARPPAPMPQQMRPREAVVVVEKPMFFGLFGPRVPVTERVVELVPPAPIGRAAPPPAAPSGGLSGAKIANGQQRPKLPASNCHYHNYPSQESPFHRDVQCHWHQNPTDPAIRYVQ
jgi:hypothetical protein